MLRWISGDDDRWEVQLGSEGHLLHWTMRELCLITIARSYGLMHSRVELPGIYYVPDYLRGSAGVRA